MLVFTYWQHIFKRLNCISWFFSSRNYPRVIEEDNWSPLTCSSMLCMMSPVSLCSSRILKWRDSCCNPYKIESNSLCLHSSLNCIPNGTYGKKINYCTYHHYINCTISGFWLISHELYTYVWLQYVTVIFLEVRKIICYKTWYKNCKIV